MRPGARTAWRWTKRIAPWALGGAVLALVLRQAHRIDWPAVLAAAQAQPLARLAAALGLVAASYAVVASFDLIGRRIVGHRLTVRRTLGTAAISYAFNLNFGAWVGGLGLRLRLYARWGLPLASASQVVAHSMLANWLGYAGLAGALLLWRPSLLDELMPLRTTAPDALGVALVGAALGWPLLCRGARGRRLTVRGHLLHLPGAALAATQVAAGMLSWALISAIVWLLLGSGVAWPDVLGVMLVAAVAGVVTQVPAGLGVIEAVFVGALGHRVPAESLIAALLVYRGVYYLLPLAAALPGYALSESAASRR